MELFIKIIKKDKLQNQDNKKKRLFKETKKEFIREPILRIYQLTLLIRVKTDSLDFILRVYLI